MYDSSFLLQTCSYSNRDPCITTSLTELYEKFTSNYELMNNFIFIEPESNIALLPTDDLS